MLKPDKMDASYEAYELKITLEEKEEEIASLQAELDSLRSMLDREREAHQLTIKMWEGDKAKSRQKWADQACEIQELKDKLVAMEDEGITLSDELHFYKWFFEADNAQSRESLEKAYGQELPEGVEVE